MNKRVALITLTLIASLSHYKTLAFYFWHDDYSIFYNIRNNICLFNWPYNSYCTLFSPIYKLFDYNPQAYFLLGLFLVIAASFIFYLFLSKLLNKQAAVFGALIFASGYIGAENALSAYSYITTNLSLLLLFVTLYLILLWGELCKRLLLILSVLLFALTLLSFPVRSSGYLVLVLALIVLFILKNKIKRKSGMVLCVSFILIFGLTYFVLPMLTTGKLSSVWERAGKPVITNLYILTAIQNYLITVGGYIFTDGSIQWIQNYTIGLNADQLKMFVAVVFHLTAVYSLTRLKRIKDKKIIVFSLLWIFSQYLPQSLVSGWALETTNRYVTFSYTGLIVLIAFLTQQKRSFKVLAVAIIFINIILSNNYFRPHVNTSTKRAEFYSELKRQLGTPIKDSIYYFDSTTYLDRNEMVDFMRVGAYGSEAALGVELGVKQSDIKILAGPEEFQKYLSSRVVNTDKIYTFYYSDGKLSNTTEYTKNVLMKNKSTAKIQKKFKTEIVYDEALKTYFGKQLIADFALNQSSFFLPTIVDLKVKAFSIDVPVPYSQSCFDCNYDSKVFNNVVNYLLGQTNNLTEKEKTFINRIKKAPAAKITDETDKLSLNSYLRRGIEACVQYQVGNYKQTIPITLKLNAVQENISFNLPAFGTSKANLSIACLEYPISLEIDSVDVRLLPNSKN